MYEAFYNLKKKPFEITTDPGFLWLGDKHREALSILTYGIQYNKGLLLLTGDVGTGKTTLIRALIHRIRKEVIVAAIPDPGLAVDDFYKTLTTRFKLKKPFSGKFAFMERFQQLLNRAYDLDRKVLLIIDEAQRMSPELMDEVRLLSNLEKDYNPLINIFFVGQMEFNDMLVDPVNRALRQRITLNFHIETLDADETGAYMAHRLQIAGGDPGLFDKGAVQAVHRLTHGYPRLINVLCDQALLNGYTREMTGIDAAAVDESAGQLRIERPEDGPAADEAIPEKGGNKGSPAPAISRSRPKQRTSLWVWLVALLVLMGVAGWMMVREFGFMGI